MRIVPLEMLLKTVDIFYTCVLKAFFHQGIETTDNRKEWPLSILRKVLEDLMDDTPDDLLAKLVMHDCCILGGSVCSFREKE